MAAAVVLAAACGGQASRAPTHAPRASICTQPSDCRLAWTEDDVCGCCGVPRRGHVEALSGAAAEERMSIGCPACACDPDPTLFATCERRRCEVVDLETSPLTACVRDDECIATPGTCGPVPALVPLRRGSEARLALALGCTPTPPSVDAGARASCESGHCRLEGVDHTTPVTTGGPPAESLPTSGTLGGCELRLGGSEAWRSWQMVEGIDGSPDDFSRVLLRISLTARCATRANVTVDGWLESGTERLPLHYELRAPSTPPALEGVLEAGRDVTLDVIGVDAPFLTAPTVRAVVRVRAADGGTLLLATPSLTVLRVS